MRIRILTVSLFAALPFFFSACRSEDILSKREMVDLYVDMFIADNLLDDMPQLRQQADTSLFFDPIFEKHGIDFETYDRSLHYYSYYSEDLADIISSVKEEFDKMQLELYEEFQELERIRKINEDNRIEYKEKDFSNDSVRWANADVLWPPKDSLSVSDSLEIKDSLSLKDDIFVSDTIEIKELRLQGDSIMPRPELTPMKKIDF